VGTDVAAGFGALWDELEPIGRDARTGGYRRFAWTRTDAVLRDWFAAQAVARGLDVTLDRAGNQWAWWGDPDAAVAAGHPGLAMGSHLDSVPDGGAFDGPLGVVSAFAALDALRAQGFAPTRPIGVVNFGDEEGARFGIACAGSRLITGRLSADHARGLTDAEGTSMASAMRDAGHDPAALGRDDDALRRVGTFVELHVEQGRGLVELGRPVAVGSSIWPHGRWRFTLRGQGNHAGTTRLADRRDPMLGYAETVLAARELAEHHGVLATCGKVRVEPNGVNAIPSLVTGWLDARGADESSVRACVAALSERVQAMGGELVEESWTGETCLDTGLVSRLARLLDGAPVLPTGAGHDAGILSNAGVASVMLFVRNPSGISHSPAEFAERADCLAGVAALTHTVTELTR
jgi:N-carbamoyl-L-amino-acid hydrolase